VTLRAAAGRLARPRRDDAVYAAIALGGACGASTRYGLAQLVPRTAGGFPWATLLANVLGCLLIGMLMVAVTEVWTAPPLVRPFLGVGVLGGFTTFSTFAVESQALALEGAAGTALLYVALTPALALVAVATGTALARTVSRPHLPHRRDSGGRTP